MVKSILNITTLLLLALLHLTLCEEIISNLNDSTVEPEISSYAKPVLVSVHSKHSSVVKDDGSFEFVAEKDGSLIEVRGSLKDVNGTKMLVLQGTYLHGHLSLSFDADENGFNIMERPALHPFGIPPKVIGTLSG